MQAIRSTSPILFFLMVVGTYETTRAESGPVIDKLMRNSVECVSLTRELAAVQKTIVAAKLEIEKLRAARPQLDDSWKRLMIGEFESEDRFLKRKQAIQNAAEAAQKVALSSWQKSVDEKAVKLNGLSAALEEKRKKTALRMEEIENIPNDVLKVTYPCDDQRLPRFDRQTMSFGDLRIEQTPKEFESTNDKSMVATLSFEFPAMEFVLPTLDEAERFKQEYQSGKLQLVWRFHPELVRVESPIIDPGKIRYEERDQVSVQTARMALVVVVVAAALGADVSKTPALPTEKVSVKVQDASVVRDGVRFQYQCVPTSPPLVVYADGKRFESAKVVLRDFDPPCEEFVRVVKLDDDSPLGNRELQPGDEIVSVDGRAVHTYEEMITMVKSFTAKHAYRIVYRRHGREGSVGAVAGQKLGISLITSTRRKSVPVRR